MTRFLMDERIDQKEDFLQELCSQYGLVCDYSCWKYHISRGWHQPILRFDRVELMSWGADRIEEVVVEFSMLDSFRV